MSKVSEKKSEEAAAPGIQMERKITNKALYGGKPSLGDEKERELGTVMGIARGIKSGESANGPWLALTGSFEAHTHDGRRLASNVVFLPDPLNGLLAEQVSDPDVDSIQFACKVKMVKSDAPMGYEYKTEMLVEPEGADPLADLRRTALPNLS